MTRHLPLALLLAGCGGPEGTWLLALDRDAATGCSEDVAGQVQHEVALYLQGDAASAHVESLGAVLTGTLDGRDLSVLQAEANAGSSAYGIEAEIAGSELSGSWLEVQPDCTQTVPLTGWTLTGLEEWLITHDPAAGERTGDCAVDTLDTPWTEVARLDLDSERASVLLDGLALLGARDGRTLDVEYVVAETGADVQIEYVTRYQLDLDAGTGTALSTRTEVRAGTTYEDCVETVPLTVSRLD